MYLVDEVVIWPAAQRIRIKCQVLGGVGILIYGRVIVNELLNILWDGYDSRSCPIVAGGGGFWEMGKPADYTHPAPGPDLHKQSEVDHHAVARHFPLDTRAL